MSTEPELAPPDQAFALQEAYERGISYGVCQTTSLVLDALYVAEAACGNPVGQIWYERAIATVKEAIR